MNEFVSWCRHLLVSFLFHALTSLHPPSFHRNDFSTCSTHFSFILVQSPRDVFFAPRARRFYARACARGEPNPSPTRVRTRKWRRSVSPDYHHLGNVVAFSQPQLNLLLKMPITFLVTFPFYGVSLYKPKLTEW